MAAPLHETDAILGRLAEKYARVAVVSGRPVSFLLDRLGDVRGVILSGLYGLERARDGIIDVIPEAAHWRDVVKEVADAAEAAVPAGVGVERKGLAVTLHVRTAPQHAGWVEAWTADQALRTGLIAHPAKMSVELRPPVEADKGRVVTELAAGLDAVCFVGDDRGDLPAFAALADLAAEGVQTLAVAVSSEEAPPELLAAADVVVAGPEGALALLRALV
jgi:trehalose 6-phosphate phosphatase